MVAVSNTIMSLGALNTIGAFKMLLKFSRSSGSERLSSMRNGEKTEPCNARLERIKTEIKASIDSG
ncbi:hypothetical protein D3C76_1657650 [compost metagenome]